ncbi:MAG: hypothetical protein CMF25_03935 [Kangiellaceae bacterium]|jgi:hypothetical protein|nr:hypothetical protein [Kangiellaceae bacterium]|tara:strand:- start:2366 stop:3070 length:705 start_codon:yes stop_codon:yes gene_type:complete
MQLAQHAIQPRFVEEGSLLEQPHSGFIVANSSGFVRGSLEDFVANKFYQSHQASIRHYLPLLVSQVRGGELKSVIGLKAGGDSPFFVEHYLDQPVEMAIRQSAPGTAHRLGIVEMGNFAVSWQGAGVGIFIALIGALQQLGYQWLVFTITDAIQRLFSAFKLPLHWLGDANIDQLPETEQAHWGSYYANQPKVFCCQVVAAAQVLQNYRHLQRVYREHAPSIPALAQQIIEAHP